MSDGQNTGLAAHVNICKRFYQEGKQIVGEVEVIANEGEAEAIAKGGKAEPITHNFVGKIKFVLDGRVIRISPSGHDLGVKKEYRRKGIEEMLLMSAVDYASEVAKSNDRIVDEAVILTHASNFPVVETAEKMNFVLSRESPYGFRRYVKTIHQA